MYKKPYTKRELREIAKRYAQNWDYTERSTMGADRARIEIQVIYYTFNTLGLLDELMPLVKEEKVKVMDSNPEFYAGLYERLRQ